MAETPEKQVRRYPRLKMSKGLMVAWQAGGGRIVSRVTTAGLGGVFIATPNPPPVGAVLKFIFTVPLGEVRARGIVRSSEPGKGMGVQFISMAAADRGRLNVMLKKLVG